MVILVIMSLTSFKNGALMLRYNRYSTLLTTYYSIDCESLIGPTLSSNDSRPLAENLLLSNMNT